MAKKKILQENGTQVWPITRVDCVYTLDGSMLLSDDYASKQYLENNCMTDEEMEDVLTEVFKNKNS